MVKGQK